nr:hypothetical protein [Tanacetum cinerariifolium]
MYNLFRVGNVTSRTTSLRSVEGRSKGGDDVGNGIGKRGGVPDNGVSDRGLAGSGGDGICGNGDEYDVSGDGGGV